MKERPASYAQAMMGGVGADNQHDSALGRNGLLRRMSKVLIRSRTSPARLKAPSARLGGGPFGRQQQAVEAKLQDRQAGKTARRAKNDAYT
jgi:hypothetical protein